MGRPFLREPLVPVRAWSDPGDLLAVPIASIVVVALARRCA